VVYGLAGGAGEKVEENKSQRWDHAYFRQRLQSGNARSAHVEVDFSFGKDIFSVRRGFSGSDVTGFKKDRSTWLEDRSEAKEAFESTLRDFGGYRSPDDFSSLSTDCRICPRTDALSPGTQTRKYGCLCF